MSRHIKKRRQYRGFSLPELALILALIGVLVQPLLQLASRLKSLPVFANLSGNSLSQAETALNGFMLANGRLPCPDTTAENIGNEVCSGTEVTGWLPVRTLGLSLTERVRYGVYRAPSATPAQDIDLATLPDRYRPLLPQTLDATEPHFLNGLDFCVGLRNLTAAVGASKLTAGSLRIPIAYGLASAGAGDADNVIDGNGKKSLFDGLNTASGQFELAGTAHSSQYNDDTRTVGAAELFTRLGCVTRLAAANAAARAAYAAYDLDQFAALYVRFRAFQISVANSNKSMADVAVGIAATDLAIALGSTADAIAILVLSYGANFIPVTLAVAGSIAAGASVAAASLGVVSKEKLVTTAQNQSDAAINFSVQTSKDLAAAVAQVSALDQKGLLP